MHDGDVIELDVNARHIDLLVEDLNSQAAVCDVRSPSTSRTRLVSAGREYVLQSKSRSRPRLLGCPYQKFNLNRTLSRPARIAVESMR